MHTTRHVGVDEIFKGIHNSGGGRNVLREAWSRAVSFGETALPKLRQMALHGRGQYFWGSRSKRRDDPGAGYLPTIKVACVWLGRGMGLREPVSPTCSRAEPGPSSGRESPVCAMAELGFSKREALSGRRRPGRRIVNRPIVTGCYRGSSSDGTEGTALGLRLVRNAIEECPTEDMQCNRLHWAGGTPTCQIVKRWCGRR